MLCEIRFLASTGGLVVGTGDLSELALGWATYNGDHMSMYGIYLITINLTVNSYKQNMFIV